MLGEDLQLFTICDEDGKELDAHFGIGQNTKTTFSLFFESAGAGKNPRNTDYNRALELALRRLGRAWATVTTFEVVSRDTMKLGPEQREFVPDGYSLPLDLSALVDDDFRQLRKKVGGGAARTGRASKVQGRAGGNTQKRLRLGLSFRPAPKLDALRQLIAAPLRYDNVEPVLAQAVADKGRSKGSKRHAQGQGLEQDPQVRRAVEEYAMRQAELHFEGWQSCRRHTENCGFDIEFVRNKAKRHVEVKGTRSVKPKTVIVTRNEVRYAFHHRTKAVLLVVSGIRVDKRKHGPVCSGGQVAVYADWAPQDWTTEVGTGLSVKTYDFTLPKQADERHGAKED